MSPKEELKNTRELIRTPEGLEVWVIGVEARLEILRSQVGALREALQVERMKRLDLQMKLEGFVSSN